MKPTPKDWPRLSASVWCDDARAEIAWLTRAFGFEVRMIVDGEDGKVAHSELTFGEAIIMVGQSGREDHARARDHRLRSGSLVRSWLRLHGSRGTRLVFRAPRARLIQLGVGGTTTMLMGFTLAPAGYA